MKRSKIFRFLLWSGTLFGASNIGSRNDSNNIPVISNLSGQSIPEKNATATEIPENKLLKIWQNISRIWNKDRIASIAVSPSGETLISGDEKGTIRVWDDELSPLFNIAPYPEASPIQQILFDPGNPRYFLVMDKSSIRIYDLALKGAFLHAIPLSGISMDMNRRHQLALNTREGIRIINLDYGIFSEEQAWVGNLADDRPHDYSQTENVSSMSLSPNGFLIAYAGISGMEIDSLRGLVNDPVQSRQSWKPSSRFAIYSSKETEIRAMAFSGNSRLLAAADIKNQQITIRLAKSGWPIVAAFRMDWGVMDKNCKLSFSRDGHYLLFSGLGTEGWIFDLRKMKPFNFFSSENEFYDARFIGNRGGFVSLDEKGNMRKWDTSMRVDRDLAGGTEGQNNMELLWTVESKFLPFKLEITPGFKVRFHWDAKIVSTPWFTCKSEFIANSHWMAAARKFLNEGQTAVVIRDQSGETRIFGVPGQGWEFTADINGHALVRERQNMVFIQVKKGKRATVRFYMGDNGSPFRENKSVKW